MVNLALAHGDLRSLRQQRGLKLRELAQLADVELSELIKCERGLALPSVEFFAKLGSALSIDPRELWTAQQRLSGEPRFGEGYVNARPRSGFVVPRRIELDPSMRPVIDLFCGTGGFSSGFESTGGFQVCAGIDLLSDRVGTFSENHPGAIAYSDDVRNLKPCRLTEESPDPYVIIGGPPCQGFSSIRPFRVLTADDPRNSLFEQFCATVAALQPEWFVFENVVGLLTHKGGSAAREIQNGFESLGYRTSSRVINAAHFGLPQRRERLIMVGNWRGKTLKWPEPTHACEHRSMAGSHGASVSPQGGLFGPKPRPAVTTMEAIGDLPALEAGQAASSYDEGRPASAYAHEMREGAVRLTMHDATRHSERMLSIIRMAGSNINALPPGTVSSGFSSCYSRLEPDEPSVTMTVNFVHPASNKCIHPYQDRALTPREGARLQGFPDAYRFIGTRSQVVKQIGNAVPPLLGKVIAEAILASE